MSHASHTALLKAPAPLIDIGVNLGSDRFSGRCAELLDQAKAANVCAMIVTGTSLQSSEQALALCNSYPQQLRCTAGIHPHDAATWNKAATHKLEQMISHPHCVAVGETGLDFNRNFSTPAQQEAAFEAQLELAITHRKPVFLHEREAFDRQHQILKSHRNHLADGVIHCFTGSHKALFDYLDLDLYIGITGWICDERRGTELKTLVRNIPLHRLMIETDAPYLLPRTLDKKPKDRINRPAYLPWILREISRSTGRSELDLAVETSDNARRFFRLADTFGSSAHSD